MFRYRPNLPADFSGTLSGAGVSPAALSGGSQAAAAASPKKQKRRKRH